MARKRFNPDDLRFNLDDFMANYPANWPPKEYFVNQQDATRSQLEDLQKLVDGGAWESELDGFLRTNPPVLVACLSIASTGHHGAWVIPQQVVLPPLSGVQRGLKPDYIIGGKSSEGFAWYVLELKGANDQIFTESEGKVYFGSVANRGVFQLLEYIDCCSSAQSYLRDTLRLTNFREPRGLLLIGREEETRSDPRIVSPLLRRSATICSMLADTLSLHTPPPKRKLLQEI